MLRMRSMLTGQYIESSEALALPRMRSLIDWLEGRHGRKLSIMSYMSYKNEFPTSQINKMILSLGHQLILPFTDDDFVITAYHADMKNSMRVSPLGIKEPDPALCEAADSEGIDLIIMPGVAFDMKGNRIGFGKGCYDRFISGIENMPVLAALAYDFQIFADIPAEPFDIPCSYIITESRTINCKHRQI